jgi:beta-lactamase class A
VVSTAAAATLSTADLDKIDTEARYAVAAIDLTTGETVSAGSGAFDTASIVKVDILAALLQQAQQDGVSLTTRQKTLATAMIERSDNSAATALFDEIGGKSGLERFNSVIGLTDTVVGSDGNWGLTRTAAADQIRLLQIVFGDTSTLTTASQAYVAELMSNVEDDQNFGVSAAADDRDDAALKVGYLQRSQTGLWDVSSIGRIEAGGHTYLVAVLSGDNATYASGVHLVNAAARAVVTALS